MNLLVIGMIMTIGLLVTGISFGQVNSVNCDGYEISYNTSKIIINSCDRDYMFGSVYSTHRNSIDLATNGESGHLELKIPKSLMAEIYQVSENKNNFSFLNWNLQKSDSNYNIITIEIPDKVSLITIFGSDPQRELTNSGGVILVILIGGGILGFVIAAKKWKFSNLGK